MSNFENIDCSQTNAGSFVIENKNYNLYNFNEISENCRIKFVECNLNIIDNFGTKFTPKRYLFESSIVCFGSISLYLDDENSIAYIRTFKGNQIKCLELKIYCQSIKLLDREILEILLNIKADKRILIIGSNANRQNVNSILKILQRFCDIIYCYSLNFPSGFPLNPSKVILIDCSGNVNSLRGLVNIIGEKTPSIKIASGTSIYAEDFSELNVFCDDRFNIYLKNPYDFKKVRYQGMIDKTNCSIVDKYKKKLYKFKTFINIDFTKNNYIQQFFNCKFYNCYFNENQMCLNSYLQKCFFTEGTDNFVNCKII